MSDDTQNCFTDANGSHELSITRVFDVPAEKLYRCWTEPALMVQWFTPPPWKTVHVETDVRPGGASYIVMQGPDGTQMPNRGVYLEVIPNRKIVFTDAYTSAWVPSSLMWTATTFAGDSALATKSARSSLNGTMSIFSPRSSLTTMRTRPPRAPTHAPTGSTLWSLLHTAIFVR